jgi:hypothetical protein
MCNRYVEATGGGRGVFSVCEEVVGIAKWLTLRKSVFVNNVVYWNLLTPEGKDTVASKHQDPITSQCSVISQGDEIPSYTTVRA